MVDDQSASHEPTPGRVPATKKFIAMMVETILPETISLAVGAVPQPAAVTRMIAPNLAYSYSYMKSTPLNQTPSKEFKYHACSETKRRKNAHDY